MKEAVIKIHLSGNVKNLQYVPAEDPMKVLGASCERTEDGRDIGGTINRIVFYSERH